MMNEQEITQLAESMVNEQLAKRITSELVEERMRLRGFGYCPCCDHHRSARTKVEGVRRCSNCKAFFGKDGYTFNFPVWARAKNAYFRRAICLTFNIQHKE